MSVAPALDPTLTWPIVLAVMGAALLHAGWNALIKAGGDKSLDTALIHVLASLVTLPMLAVVGLPPPSAWPYLLTSLLVHIGYYFALARAYQHGELGLTYPIMRGTAPLLVALGSAAVLAEAPSPVAWLGIAAVTVGIGLVGLSNPGRTLHQRKAIGFALANAAIIAIYTLVDGRGVRLGVTEGGTVASYVVTLFAFDGWPFALLVWWRRGAAARPAILAHARQRWAVALIGGLASLGAYGIALWAMTRAPVASVAALRETSVLFAALMGSLLLGERFGAQRALGTLVIVAGVMTLRLA